MPLLSHLISCTPTKSNLYLANFLAAAVSQPALYKLLTFHIPNLMSLFRCLGSTKVSIQVRGILYECFVTWYFLRWVVSTSPNPQAGGPPLVGCLRMLIQYIRSYPSHWRPFLHPQPDDAPCRGDRLSTCTITYSQHFLYYLDAFQAMVQAVTVETQLRSRAILYNRVGLGQVLLSSVLLFSLSVSFHQCSTLSSSGQCSCQTNKPAKTWKTSNKAELFLTYTFHILPYAAPLPPISSHAIKYKCNVL